MRSALEVAAKLARVSVIYRIARHPIARRQAVVAILAALVAVVALAACGGSSKPSYCSQVQTLKTSIEDLGKVNVVKNGTSALSSALQKVESSANSVVNSAKSDFPSQTSAISSSVTAVETTAKSLVSNPKQPALITELPSQISALTKSINTFISDTKSKCG